MGIFDSIPGGGGGGGGGFLGGILGGGGGDTPQKNPDSVNQAVDQVPPWFEDFQKIGLQRRQALGEAPYQAYGGPRIAPFNEDQQRAFQMTREGIGSHQPYMDKAGASYDQASNYLTTEGDINPYIENVLNLQREMSERDLNERFMPGLSRHFTSGGAYGSRGPGTDSMESVGIRGVRDISEGLERQRLATLGGAWNDAQQLQMQKAQGAMGLGQGYSGLGADTSRMNLADIMSLQAIGQQQQGQTQRSLNLAREDFNRQEAYPRQMLDWIAQANTGPIGSTRTMYGDQGYAPSQAQQNAAQGGGGMDWSQLINLFKGNKGSDDNAVYDTTPSGGGWGSGIWS